MTHSTGHSWLGKGAGRNPSRPLYGPFEDILDERRKHGEIGWLMRSREFAQYRFKGAELSPAEIKRQVLTSDRLKYGLKKISEETGTSEGDLGKQCEEILGEMSHNLSMRSVRSFGFFLAKVMKRIYQGVYVNRDGIEQLRAAVKDYPVVLLPSHRSYADFLLFSLVLFDYDIPLPVIAAAMDFMNMSFFGSLLRNCGAFFIRRSFVSDALYWLVFTEYVRLHVRLGQHPVQFFLEGTRSRTAKSLVPKIGMLSAILESWFLGEVPDVYLVPVSISHDRILEESLYAFELLGIPKPKESASGLLKARHILSDNYGSVYLYFDKPISLRQLAEGKVDRGLHNLQCRLDSFLFPPEMHFLRQVAKRMVVQQQKFAVISPWCLHATCLLQNPQGLPASQLAMQADWLRSLLTSLGAFVSWPVEPTTTPLEVLRKALLVHANLVSVESVVPEGASRPVEARSRDMGAEDLVRPLYSLEVPSSTDPGQSQGAQSGGELMTAAALRIQLASYRNQLMHCLVREALVSALISAAANNTELESGWTMEMGKVKTDYVLLEKLLSRDFLFDVNTPEENFDIAVRNLVQVGGVFCKPGVNGNCIDIKKSQTRCTTFLSRVVESFLIGYWLVCSDIMHGSAAEATSDRPPGAVKGSLADRDWAKRVQTIGFSLAKQDAVFHLVLDVLSLDLLTNAVTSLRKMHLLPTDDGGHPGREQLKPILQLLRRTIGNGIGNISTEKYWPSSAVRVAKL